MRESKFIAQNRDKWKKYEEGIRNDSLPAEEMERAFIELNDDLAFARTFYKNRAVRLFLNNLLAPVYIRIYKVRKWNWASVRDFFANDAPLMNYQARYYMLVSFIIVVIGVAIGFMGTRHNMEFASTVLSEDYVRTTEYNISRGDPLAIYKYEDPGDMFKSIALNNLLVALRFFMFGALFCVGTMYLLLINGIVLGAFTYLFTSKGLTADYLLTVYQHGTLEMLSMVVEGAAGIMMGAGFLFPGTKSRLRSIQDAGKKSILMFLVCVPIIIIAAFIESYLTRFTEIPDVLRTGVIVLSLIFMLSYFVILPQIRFRGRKDIEGKYDELKADIDNTPEPGKIYSIGRITLLAFDFLKRHGGKILLISFLSISLFVAFKYFGVAKEITDDIDYSRVKMISQSYVLGEAASSSAYGMQLLWFHFSSQSYIFSAKHYLIAIALSFVLFFALWWMIFYLNRKLLEGESEKKIGRWRLIGAAFFCSAMQVTFNFMFGSAWWVSMALFFPFLSLAGVVFVASGEAFFTAFFNAIGYLFRYFWRYIAVVSITVLLYFIIFTGISILDIRLLLDSEIIHGSLTSAGIVKFVVYLNYFLIPLALALFAYIHFFTALGIYESMTGEALHKTIQGFTFKKEVYGIETE